MAKTQAVDQALLDLFLQGFYGYGDFGARYWFVGKEEAGEDSVDEINGHVATWDELGRPELADLAVMQGKKGDEKYFAEGAPLHPAWRGLVRLVLATERGEGPATDDVRAYQIEQLGRSGGNTALLDLLPLPASANAGEESWPYAAAAPRAELESRAGYMEWSAPWRAEHLRNRLVEHRPRAVFFYTTDLWYVAWWQLIAVAHFERIRIGDRKIYVGKEEGTVFVVMAHPGAPGVKNAFLDEVGKIVHDAA